MELLHEYRLGRCCVNRATDQILGEYLGEHLLVPTKLNSFTFHLKELGIS